MRRRRVIPLLATGLLLVGAAACSDEPTYFEPTHVEGSGTPPNPTPEEATAGAAIVGNVMTFLDPQLLTISGGDGAWSPLAMTSVLAQLRAGSRGDVAASLDEVFGADGGSEAFTGAVHAADETARRLDGPTGGPGGKLRHVEVGRGDALWGRSGTTWTPAFLDQLTGGYSASMWMADMVNDPQRATAAINQWVTSRTGDQVEQILPVGAIRDETRLVVTSALSFSAPWETPMAALPDATFRDPGAPDPEIDVATIGVDASLVVRRGLEWRSVTIPYAGNAVAMTIVVPDRDRDPGPVELLAALVPELTAPAEPADVSLSMPVFSVDAPVGNLQALTPIFTPGADLFPMTDDTGAQPLRVDSLHQQTVVDVDAAGTSLPDDADAAPAEPGSVTGEGETFAVDRPFTFVIHDVEVGVPLIVGWIRRAPTSR